MCVYAILQVMHITVFHYNYTVTILNERCHSISYCRGVFIVKVIIMMISKSIINVYIMSGTLCLVLKTQSSLKCSSSISG